MCIFFPQCVYLHLALCQRTISWDYQERNVDLFPWSWNASKYYVDFLTSLGKCLLTSQLNAQIMQTIISFSIINVCFGCSSVIKVEYFLTLGRKLYRKKRAPARPHQSGLILWWSRFFNKCDQQVKRLPYCVWCAWRVPGVISGDVTQAS